MAESHADGHLSVLILHWIKLPSVTGASQTLDDVQDHHTLCSVVFSLIIPLQVIFMLLCEHTTSQHAFCDVFPSPPAVSQQQTPQKAASHPFFIDIPMSRLSPPGQLPWGLAFISRVSGTTVFAEHKRQTVGEHQWEQLSSSISF